MTSGLTLVVTAVAARTLFEVVDMPRLVAGLVALVPIAAFAWFMWSEVRAVRSCDELQQRVQLEALAVAYPIAILLVYGVGFFEAAGFTVRGFESTHDLWWLTVLPYFLGLWLAKRRYQ